MSNEPKYQVFISSTYTDLKEARSAAINTVLESYNFPVGMELFGADNDEQWTIIKELIDSSDFYILILGHRYGSISKQDGISFTEKEFDYALEKGTKLMCFVRNDNVPTLPHERDSNNENIEKLQQFRQKVLTDRLCEFWDNVDDLKHKISSSLYKNMRKHGGVGWVRGNQVSGQLAEEIAKLSEENRKLREENESLKKNSATRKPQLKISLNNFSNDSDITDQLININFPILPENKKFKRPEKRNNNILGKELANLNSSIASLTSIWAGKPPEAFYDAYNADIDAITDTQISSHNLSLQLLEQLRKGCRKLNIKIENFGTLIATNVYVEIKLPDFVIGIDDNDKYDIEYYKKDLSKDLIRIDTPEMRSENSKHSLLDPPPMLAHRNLNLNNSSHKPIKDYIKNHVIYISLDSLLHSKNEIFDNYYIFPTKTGSGVIEVKLICAEYSHPETFEIPITVE